MVDLPHSSPAAHLLWLRISLTKVKARLRNVGRAPQEHSSWEESDIPLDSTADIQGYYPPQTLTHLIGIKLDFHLALLKFNKKKFWKSENDQITTKKCSKSIFNSNLRQFPVDSPYWQRGPWNPAGHWHTWDPSSEHFPPLKQVPAVQSTRAHKQSGTGDFSWFCAKDPPELPLWHSPVPTRLSKWEETQIFI